MPVPFPLRKNREYRACPFSPSAFGLWVDAPRAMKPQKKVKTQSAKVKSEGAVGRRRLEHPPFNVAFVTLFGDTKIRRGATFIATVVKQPGKFDNVHR